MPVLEAVSRAGKSLLIIAEDIEGEAPLTSCSILAVRGAFLRRCREGSGLR